MSYVLRSAIGVFLCLGLVFSANAQDNNKKMRIAVTTSFDNSGLADLILPAFTKQSGIKIEMVVVGTGQALKLGKRGDVDAVLVHAKPTELKYLKDGHASDRREIMYNDFIIVGPKSDPAKIRGVQKITQALQRIKNSKSIFLSRGDDSGTHKKEISLWKSAGMNMKTYSGSWYRRTGSGMGATLNTGAALNGYIMVDRGTWLNFKNKQQLELLMAGDPPLFNQYGFLIVNQKRHPHVKSKFAMTLRDWLTSREGQELIGSYRVKGQQLFVPNYQPQS
jgi:tungstate transport system substrate-binding protein